MVGLDRVDGVQIAAVPRRWEILDTSPTYCQRINDSGH
jgi:hypothetical protein